MENKSTGDEQMLVTVYKNPVYIIGHSLGLVCAAVISLYLMLDARDRTGFGDAFMPASALWVTGFLIYVGVTAIRKVVVNRHGIAVYRFAYRQWLPWTVLRKCVLVNRIGEEGIDEVRVYLEGGIIILRCGVLGGDWSAMRAVLRDACSNTLELTPETGESVPPPDLSRFVRGSIAASVLSLASLLVSRLCGWPGGYWPWEWVVICPLVPMLVSIALLVFARLDDNHHQ